MSQVTEMRPHIPYLYIGIGGYFLTPHTGVPNIRRATGAQTREVIFGGDEAPYEHLVLFTHTVMKIVNLALRSEKLTTVSM